VFDNVPKGPPTTPAYTNITKADVLNKLGSPYLKEVNDQNAFLKTELWYYRHDIAWRGIVLYAIVPLPLMVPVGFNHVTYKFENDNLASESLESGEPRIHGGGYKGAIIFVCWWCDLDEFHF
jgi:hypothetical protein